MTVVIKDLTKVIVFDATNNELKELFSARITAAKNATGSPNDMRRLLDELGQLYSEIAGRLD